MFTAHPTSTAIRRRLKPCFLNTSISIYTSFVITGASNTPIFSTRCINFQSLACINLYPLLRRQRNRTFLPRLGESNIGQKKKLAQPRLMFVEGCN